MAARFKQLFSGFSSSHQPLFWSLQIGGWLAMACLSYVALTLWYTTAEVEAHVTHSLAQAMVALVLSLGLRYVFVRLWDQPVVRRMLLCFVSVVLVAFIWNVLRLQLYIWIVLGAFSDPLEDSDRVYDKASVFFNFGIEGTELGEKVYYWDDVNFGSSISPAKDTADQQGTSSIRQADLPLTFDDPATDYALIDFAGNYTVIGNDPAGGEGKVAISTRAWHAYAWAGTTMSRHEGFASPIPISKANSTMSMRVYAPDVGTRVRLKLENHKIPHHAIETEVITTQASEWELLIFDFTKTVPSSVESDRTRIWDEFGGWYFTALLVFLCWASLYHGIKYALMFQEERDEASVEAREAHLESLTAATIAKDAQLQMLRYQLNPHFLFNTLNAIYALIKRGDKEPAKGMVLKLSQFLRYSLDSNPNQQVTLSKELEALNLYLEIEKVRFGNRLQFQVDIEPAAGLCLVPELLLQPLVENAIKYAIAAQEDGGTIQIDATVKGSDLVLTVSDDGPGVELQNGELPTMGGIGLQNTQNRLETLYGDQQTFSLEAVEPHGLRIVMQLPYRK